jgi:hypothetical protein
LRVALRPACTQAGLQIVAAVAAGLERIDAHRLLAGEAGGGRDLGVGRFEIRFGLRPVRHEIELLGGGLQKFRNRRNRHRRPLRIAGRRHVAGRPRRPGIGRRLRQHIVVDDDRLAGPALGIAHPPLVGDRLPVGLGLLLEGGAGADIGLDRRICRGRNIHRLVRCLLRVRRHGGAEQRGHHKPDRKLSYQSVLRHLT